VKLPSDLNGVELARRLQRLDYAVTRQSGSHMRLTRQGPHGQQHITIPAHKPLRVGTLRQILKDVASHCLIELSDLLDQLEG
jgi:predicted RNA binding protein YcfA (HicA-like mRNA interferase family)